MIEALKNDIMGLDLRIEDRRNRIAELQEELKNLEQQLVQRKLQLADAVLGLDIADDNDTERPEKFVTVQFKNGGKTYDYLIDPDISVACGDFVTVRNRYGHYTSAEVVNVFFGERKPGVYYAWAEYHG